MPETITFSGTLGGENVTAEVNTQPRGATGAAGSDATVTNANVNAAIAADTNATWTALGDVTLDRIQDIGYGKLIGRHTAGDGTPQEVGIDGGLEIHGGNIRRAALTGDITASAGSNTTTLANTAVTAGSYTAASITVDSKGRITAASNTSSLAPTAHASTHATGGSDPLTPAAIGAATPASVTAAIGAKALALGPILLVGDGQSNMVQVSTTTVTILRSDVFVWNGSTWLTAGATSVGAMVIRAAERLAAETDRPVYCVISGLNGAAISNWVGSGASSARYVATKALVEGALASTALTTLSKTKIDAFVWMQGEADSNSTTYVANFETLASQLAAETWWDVTGTRVIMPRVSTFYDGNAIRSSQIQLGNTSPWRVSVSTFGAGLEVDGFHFSLAGHNDIGLRIARAYQNTPRQSIEATNIRTVGTSIFAGIRAGGGNTGTQAILIGTQSGTGNTGSDVVGIGWLSLENNTQSFAVAVGARSGEENTGTNGTFIGYFAGQNNTGNSSTLIGSNAGGNNTGASATFIGSSAGQSNTGGSTSGLGFQAAQNNTAARLTAVGLSAGRFNKGQNATYLGAEAGPQSDANGTSLNFANITVLGYQAQASRANQVTLGGPAVVEVITPATKIIFGALPNYANDAAADADATLISGSLYRVAGGRGVFQKP
jgi:hypothetical protein